MYELILENANGDQLTFNQNSPFTISEIQGLNPPDATINTSEIALVDGAKFNSSKLNMRTINVAFAIEYDAPKNRIEVFKVLKSKQYVKLYYNGQYRQVYIEGYIQSIGIDYFAMKQIVTCTILCPSPYFREAEEVVNEMSTIVSAFHFPFSSTESPQLVMSYLQPEGGVTIENEGEADCGMIIELYAKNSVTNPKIYNYITREFFGVDFAMQAEDLITIDTGRGQKSVTLTRSGADTNLFNYVMEGSTWLQLSAFGGTFTYDVSSGDAGDLIITFKHYNLYEGV